MKQQDPTFYCLRLCAFQNPDTERITACCKHRAAPGAAMTGNGAILLSSHSPSVIRVFGTKPSQAMGAAVCREPAGG